MKLKVIDELVDDMDGVVFSHTLECPTQILIFIFYFVCRYKVKGLCGHPIQSWYPIWGSKSP